MEMLGLPDGSALVISGLERPQPTEELRPSGTLFSPSDVAAFAAEAVAAGITFDVLKGIVLSLVGKGWKRKDSTMTAEAVTRTVSDYLRANGYTKVSVTEVKCVAGEGWTLVGHADGCAFLGTATIDGRLMHVRVR